MGGEHCHHYSVILVLKVDPIMYTRRSVLFYVTFKDFQNKICCMDLPLFGCNAAI